MHGDLICRYQSSGHKFWQNDGVSYGTQEGVRNRDSYSPIVDHGRASSNYEGRLEQKMGKVASTKMHMLHSSSLPGTSEDLVEIPRSTASLDKNAEAAGITASTAECIHSKVVRLFIPAKPATKALAETIA